MTKPSDPTKDPAFQKVVQAFLQTPPKPHKGPAKKRAKAKKAKAKPRVK
jgi:hypothetical protein